MTTTDDRVARRANTLVRLYPPKWRTRYGDEFAELLADDMRERGATAALSAGVLRGAAAARLRESGVGFQPLDAPEQIKASMTTLVWSLATCFVVGVAMWSQVVVGWRWEPPSGRAVAVAMVVMSTTLAILGVLAVCAFVPIAWTFVRSLPSGGGRRLIAPALVALTSGGVVVIGCRHFAGGWPGTGGHDWGHHALVPAGLASFGWAATRGISSYWAHPTTLTSFPVNEVLWMFGSPIALSALIASSARIVRGLELSPRVMRYETTLAVIATAVTLTLFFGAGAWVVDNGAPGPTGIYRVGLIDVAGLAVMATACAVAGRAVLRAHDAIRLRNHALVA